eukprot:scaffold323033_cov37-Prasinocladus_malaysianus.AAC.1
MLSLTPWAKDEAFVDELLQGDTNCMKTLVDLHTSLKCKRPNAEFIENFLHLTKNCALNLTLRKEGKRSLKPLVRSGALRLVIDYCLYGDQG